MGNPDPSSREVTRPASPQRKWAYTEAALLTPLPGPPPCRRFLLLRKRDQFKHLKEKERELVCPPRSHKGMGIFIAEAPLLYPPVSGRF